MNYKMINIRELITDPDFCQPNGIEIIRRTSKIVNHKVESEEEKINISGIITISDENEDELLPESDRNKESIHIFTHERLKTVGNDKNDFIEYLSDIVLFNGNKYVVRYCLDDSQYGFCRSTAVKIEQDVM